MMENGLNELFLQRILDLPKSLVSKRIDEFVVTAGGTTFKGMHPSAEQFLVLYNVQKSVLA